MEFILVEFCGMSGQRVSRAKSRIWFSQNTPCYLRNSISSKFKIPIIGNLGIPLLQDKPTRKFCYLVDKVNRRLAGWKLKTLSRVGRLLLIKSTLMAIPVYSMQTTAIPVAMVKEVDRAEKFAIFGKMAEDGA